MLPSVLGIMLRYCKDPYSPTSKMECHKFLTNTAQLSISKGMGKLLLKHCRGGKNIPIIMRSSTIPGNFRSSRKKVTSCSLFWWVGFDKHHHFVGLGFLLVSNP